MLQSTRTNTSKYAATFAKGVLPLPPSLPPSLPPPPGQFAFPITRGVNRDTPIVFNDGQAISVREEGGRGGGVVVGREGTKMNS